MSAVEVYETFEDIVLSMLHTTTTSEWRALGGEGGVKSVGKL
jgi:hypothetical protein